MHLLLLLAAALLLACTPGGPASSRPRQATGQGAKPSTTSDSGSRSQQAGNTAARQQASTGTAEIGRTPQPLAPNVRTELVAEGLQLPANLTFAPDGRLFLGEVSSGGIRVIERGVLLSEPFAQLDMATGPEMGLLGLTLDPDFTRTHYVYAFYSQSKNEKPWRNRLVRFSEQGGRGTDLQVILDDLPVGSNRGDAGHNGGRLAFGPDGKLYVTIGDVGLAEQAQDKAKLPGKLLRLNRDGTIPSDNPFPGSPVYAIGLRNAWGLAFHPLSGVPYVTENGGKGHDEVNRIVPGGNYGAPRSEGVAREAPFVDPLWETGTDRGGIGGLGFYTGDLFPQYKNDLLFCTFATSRLIRLRLALPDYDRVEQEELLSRECNLDVVSGPDGAIYFSSVSKVMRLVPE